MNRTKWGKSVLPLGILGRMPDSGQRPPGGQPLHSTVPSTTLGFEQREREAVATRKYAKTVSAASLSIARARLVDMLAKETDERLLERIRVRGAVLNEEIARRESDRSPARGLLRGLRLMCLSAGEDDVEQLTDFSGPP
jgi:hypothetical protein